MTPHRGELSGGRGLPLANVSVRDEGEVTIAAIQGEVDVSNAPDVARALSEISNQPLGLVLDLTALEYIDSTAISLLYELARRLRTRSQPLVICCPETSWPRRILELTSLHNHTPVVDTVQAAIEAVLA